MRRGSPRGVTDSTEGSARPSATRAGGTTNSKLNSSPPGGRGPRPAGSDGGGRVREWGGAGGREGYEC